MLFYYYTMLPSVHMISKGSNGYIRFTFCNASIYNGFLYNLIVLISTKFGIPFDIDYINTILISALELELG